MVDSDNGKFVFFSPHTFSIQGFDRTRQLTKGFNDAIKHGAHEMDWLLMKAGKWGVGKVAVLPEETAGETSTPYDVEIQQCGHKLVRCLWHKVA